MLTTNYCHDTPKACGSGLYELVLETSSMDRTRTIGRSTVRCELASGVYCDYAMNKITMRSGYRTL